MIQVLPAVETVFQYSVLSCKKPFHFFSCFLLEIVEQVYYCIWHHRLKSQFLVDLYLFLIEFFIIKSFGRLGINI